MHAPIWAKPFTYMWVFPCLAFAAGEMLHMAEPFLEKNIHPTVIVRAYARALEDAIKVLDQMAFPIDTNDRSQMLNVVNSCIGTKFTHRFGNLMAVGAAECCQPGWVHDAMQIACINECINHTLSYTLHGAPVPHTQHTRPPRITPPAMLPLPKLQISSTSCHGHPAAAAAAGAALHPDTWRAAALGVSWAGMQRLLCACMAARL